MASRPRSSNLQKKLDRLAELPKDYEWGEATALLSALGFKTRSKGGSHVRFYDPDEPSRVVFLARPHGRNPATILSIYLKELHQSLKDWGFYDE